MTAAIKFLLHGVGNDPVPVENVFPFYSGSFLSLYYCGFAVNTILLSISEKVFL